MKKTTLFLILAFALCILLQGQNRPASPLITIEEASIELGDLLEEITRQSRAGFIYNSKVLDPQRVISFSIKNATLEQTLDLLAKKIDVKYTIIDGEVVLNFADKPKPVKEPLVTLTGFLADQSSGDNIISATVYAKGTSFGTFTNEFGYYSLTLKVGKYTLVYSHVSYEKKEIEIEVTKPIRRNISLPPKSFDLPEIVIGPPLDDILNKKQLGEMVLSPDDLNRMPEFAGEPGLVNGLQSLPGIKTHSDGSAYFYSRGGERDQNMIFIDDAPIFNPSHLFGFYSMFVPDFTKNITVYKSDMPANVGDRLSSIISIRTKDGNLNKPEFNGALNPFVGRLSLEMPLIKDKSSFFVNFRRSNFGWMYKWYNRNADIKFSDFHFKWNGKINENNRLYFTAIRSVDLLQTTNQGVRTGITWGNIAGTIRWNHIFNPRLFSNTTIYMGAFENRLFLTPNLWKSGIGVLSFKTDFTHFGKNINQSRFGLEVQAYFNDPGSVSVDSTFGVLPSLSPNYARKTVLYYQGERNIRKKWKVNVGFRLINWANLGPTGYYTFDENHQVSDTLYAGSGPYNSYFQIDPRMSLQYRLTESSQLKLGFGRYHQFLQMISNSISPFTTLELWLPANPNILPQNSLQWSLGYLKYFEEAKMEISAAAYHKSMNNQIDYQGHALTYLNPLLEGEMRFGSTRAYGMEFLLKKDLGRLNGWIAYNWSRVFRQTKGLNNGETYLAFQDRPHDLSISLHYTGKKRVVYAAYWTSYSGSTFSSPTSWLEFNDQRVPVFAERNNDRLPAYHRLDFSVRWQLNKNPESKFKHSLTFSMNNVLGHKNVFAIRFNRMPGISVPIVVKANVLNEERLQSSQVYLVRFFPSLTYRFKL